jgi:iron(III) transport system permease protein
MPALLASAILSFVRSMESFEMEQLLGTPARIFVFTTRIYDLIYGGNIPHYGPAMVLSLILLVLTFSLVLVQIGLLRGKSFTTVSGRGYKAKPLELGRWRWATFGVIVGFFLVFGVLPFAILAINSFMRVSGFFNADLFTTRHWDVVLHRASLVDSIKNTLIVGVGAATLGVIACALLSYTVTRTRWKGRRVLDVIAWIPWAVPGIVIALGFLWAFVSLPIYGTLWLLILVYVARGFPIGSRFFTSTMVQVGNELEESSRIHGASWTRTLIHIWLPLLRPAVIGAWILLFVISVRVLDSALLLAGPTTRVLSVDIFQLQTTGRAEQASVLAIIQTGIIIVGYLASRLLLRGSQRPSV